MKRRVPETNERLPPELKRTLDFWRRSSHCGVGSNWYFSFSCFSGGLLNSHMPSSPNARSLRPRSKMELKNAPERIFRIRQHNRELKRDNLLPMQRPLVLLKSSRAQSNF